MLQKRDMKVLRERSARGCDLCRLLVKCFKLDTVFWANVNLLGRTFGDVVLAATLTVISKNYVLVIPETNGHSSSDTDILLVGDRAAGRQSYV